jgi:hypothetical protein
MVTVTARGEPYNGTPFAVPGRFEAEEFDRGGEGIGYHSVGPLLLTNISFQAEGLVTNIISRIPRARPDADLGVADSGTFFRGSRILALRAGEWVRFSVSNQVAGYYSLQLKTQGPVSYTTDYNLCSGFSQSTGAAPVLRAIVAGVDLGLQSVHTDRLSLPRVWLSEGLHQIQVEAYQVDDLMPKPCVWDFGQSCSFDGWIYSTLVVDWIELVPAPLPLVPKHLAGAPKALVDGVGGNASWSNGLLIGETPVGDLLALDAKSIRVIGRDGTVRTLAGNPLNPPRVGAGTNAGFGAVLDTAVTASGDVLVVQAGSETNSSIYRVDPSGVVSLWFQGGAPHPQSPNLCFNVHSGWGDCPTVAITHLVAAAEGSILAWGDYDSSTLCKAHWIIPGRTTVSYAASANEPVVFTRLSVANGALVFDPKPVGPGFRLTGNVLEQETLPGFFLPIATGLTSAYQAKDGTLWGSDRSAIYRLFPATNGSYLQATGFPQGTVDGIPSRLVFPHESIALRARGSGPFWKFVRWSDGNTNNPRTLSIIRDTHLRAEFEFRLPHPQGIRPATLRQASATHLRFEVVGSDDYLMPYQYRLEGSSDLKVWTSVNGATVLDGAGEFASGIVTARRPATIVQIPIPSANRYYRASLISN